MHTHFEDGDWRAAVARHKASTAIPSSLVVPGLADTRTALSDDRTPEPSQAGGSFDELLAQHSNGVANVLSAQHRAILDDAASKEATTLREALVQGRWTVEQTTEAFLRKAALAQQVLGCYTQVFFERARQRAKELDALRSDSSSNEGSLGRLFGVPISVKAHLGYEGSGSDRGFVFDVLDDESVKALLDKEESKPYGTGDRVSDSTLALLRKQGSHVQTTTGHAINMLLAEGAIIIGKTTMPQSIMQLDTRSHLHGQTLNPYNVHLSPGGSSGGEAASVASRATLLGLGTDIGGSVRQPASCVGLYGLRCAIGRINVSGTRTTMLGNEGVLGICGPFAHSLRDLALMTSVLVTNANASDPFLCPPLPWRGVQSPAPARRLTVGVMLDDGFVQPITPIRRTLAHVVQKLQVSDEVDIVFVDPADFGKRGWWLARELYFMENGELLRSLARLTGEPLVKLTEYVFSPPVHAHSASDCWLLQYTRETFKRQFWQHVFVQSRDSTADDAPLDVLLCPAAALAAPRPQHIRYWGYTSLFNVTDLPGLTFPVKNAFANAQADEAFEATSQGKRKPTLSDLDEETQREYESHRNVFERAPIGLQAIGHRFKEEELLGAVQIIVNILDKQV